jgi:hypothetical protein
MLFRARCDAMLRVPFSGAPLDVERASNDCADRASNDCAATVGHFAVKLNPPHIHTAVRSTPKEFSLSGTLP